jgi:hypothetical protein
MVNKEAYLRLVEELQPKGVTLVAVSKFKTVADIQALYDLGQRDFGENYVQELLEKESQLPKDIRWHFIGHLQTNKVKYIAPFVHLVHGVDSLKLLKEIDKQGLKLNKKVPVLLQIHIAQEETKFGMDEQELAESLTAAAGLDGVSVKGLMGMASFSDDQALVRTEFKQLTQYYSSHKMEILSMGMSGDYKTAVEEGSNLVRIGSLLFGKRD